MWNAEVYNRYGKERIQPSLDLVNRISDKEFKRILDVGCGTGMSTATLVASWKTAEIMGVDLSKEMLQKAKESISSVIFMQRDCSQPLHDLGKFDLIFSNAFLQWIANQEEFIAHSFEMLHDGGTFAMQIPLFDEMPANQCIIDAEKIMVDKFIGLEKYMLFSSSEYYDIVSKYSRTISMWITDYGHEMENYNQLVDFLKGAALRPYLDRLDEGEQEIFLNHVLRNLEKSYPYQANGKIIFPFRRLFLVAEK